jgi:hypothetical protein
MPQRKSRRCGILLLRFELKMVLSSDIWRIPTILPEAETPIPSNLSNLLGGAIR